MRRIVDNIQKVGGKIAGVVVNKMQLSAKKYEQSYYYYGSTGMVVDDKNKKGRRHKKNSEIIYIETRNRNTARARQLVKQNQKDEKIEKQKEENIEKQKDENMEYNIKQEQEEKKDFSINKEKDSKINSENIDISGLDEKTKDIIRQINEYLENEKKNLNN